jgi:hypothetical protein
LVHWRRWKAANRVGAMTAAKWEMAAVACMAVATLTAITDNTFHYPHVTAPSFIVIAIADYWHRFSKARGKV